MFTVSAPPYFCIMEIPYFRLKNVTFFISLKLKILFFKFSGSEYKSYNFSCNYGKWEAVKGERQVPERQYWGQTSDWLLRG